LKVFQYKAIKEKKNQRKEQSINKVKLFSASTALPTNDIFCSKKKTLKNRKTNPLAQSIYSGTSVRFLYNKMLSHKIDQLVGRTPFLN